MDVSLINQIVSDVSISPILNHLERTNTKLSVEEVFFMYGINIKNDVRNKFFWDVQFNKDVTITEEVLDWIGYSGSDYQAKKRTFRRLFQHKCDEELLTIVDQENPTKTYYVLPRKDFEMLIMQMRTPKAQEIRELYLKIKEIILLYMAYESHCNSVVILRQQQQLTAATDAPNVVYDLSEIKTYIKNSYASLNNVVHIVRKMDYLVENNRDMLHQMQQQVNTLVFASLQQQQATERAGGRRKKTTSTSNNNTLVMYRLGEGKWYFICRRSDGFYEAERLFFKLNPDAITLSRWSNVPPGIKYGNFLEKTYNNLHWHGRDRILKVVSPDEQSPTEEQLIEYITAFFQPTE